MRTFLRVLAVWAGLVALYAVRIPEAFTKMYAEDGMFLGDALNVRFPANLLISYAGYPDVTNRLVGNLVALFPLSLTPLLS